MALIIEDGSTPAGAVSFVTVAEWETYATSRGVALNGTEEEKEVSLRKAADYFFLWEQKFQGYRSEEHQSLPFPRYPLYVYGYYVESTEIHEAIKKAQFELATFISDGGDLQPNGTGKDAKKEKVGSLEVEYFETGGAAVLPVPSKALPFLEPLLNGTSEYNLHATR
jgi:hypothetical protein